MNLFEKELAEARVRPLDSGRLCEAHLKNLRESGLDDDTIERAGLACVSAASAEEYLGFSPGAECLVFEYLKAGGDVYYRLKPLRPLHKQDGHSAKYLARTGSGNRLYISQIADADALGDTTVPLFIVEGEKKALKACQEGYIAVGIAGAWSWRTGIPDGAGDTVPLPEFDAIPWSGRTVYIVFDSDAVRNADVQKAEEALAWELQRYGARVLIVRLPELGGERAGLDDFLVQKGTEAFGQLLCQASPSPASYLQGRTFVPLRLAKELRCRADYVYARDEEMGGGPTLQVRARRFQTSRQHW